MEWVALVLAAYRVSYMIAYEEGPGGIIAAVQGRIDPLQKTWLGRGIRCVFCISFWITLLGAALLLEYSTWQTFVLSWLSAAAGVMLLHRWMR